MSSLITPDSELSEEFYQQPCWLDIWLDQCSTTQLEFWSRFDEFDALVLLSLLEQAEFVTQIGGHASREPKAPYSTAFSCSSNLLPDAQVLQP